VVAFSDTERLVGDGAVNQAAMNAKNTIFEVRSAPATRRRSCVRRPRASLRPPPPPDPRFGRCRPSRALAARRRALTRRASQAKRLIGRKWSDPTVKDDRESWPFKVIASPEDKPLFQVEYKSETKQVLRPPPARYALSPLPVQRGGDQQHGADQDEGGG